MYRFDKELRQYANMHAPLNRTTIAISQRLLGLGYDLERDDRYVHVSKLEAPLGQKPGREVQAARVLLYEPKGDSRALPCVYFIHGGGFVFNAAPHHFLLARRFTMELGVRTALVDYRLAPRYTFPTAHYDCLNVYKWLRSNANALNIDPNRIAVVGDSAGGNIAAAMCLMANDMGIPEPRLQMLLYPVLDRRMQTGSYRTFTDTPMCNSKDMEKYFRFYVGDVMSVGKSLVPYISPLEATSFVGMPPTYVEVAQLDCLHDEGIQYAQALKDSGIPVDLTEVHDAMHGYDIAQKKPFMDNVMQLRTCFMEKYL